MLPRQHAVWICLCGKALSQETPHHWLGMAAVHDAGGGARPAEQPGKGEMQVVPVPLGLLGGISVLRVALTPDLRLPEPRRAMFLLLQACLECPLFILPIAAGLPGA